MRLGHLKQRKIGFSPRPSIFHVDNILLKFKRALEKAQVTGLMCPWISRHSSQAVSITEGRNSASLLPTDALEESAYMVSSQHALAQSEPWSLNQRKKNPTKLPQMSCCQYRDTVGVGGKMKA